MAAIGVLLKNAGKDLGRSQFGSKQEIATIDILFRQNGIAVYVQLLYAVPYVYASWGVASHVWLVSWLACYLTLACLRAALSQAWKRHMPQLMSISEARKWLRAFQVLLMLSGACWIPIALDFTDGTQTQQLLSGLSLIFMCAGCVCLYAGSLSTIYMIVVPCFVPWIAALLMAKEHSLNVVGVMAGIYFLVGTQVAKALSRYMVSSLRTTIEYANAKEELHESSEKLSMALESSSAMTWSWDLETKNFAL